MLFPLSLLCEEGRYLYVWTTLPDASYENQYSCSNLCNFFHLRMVKRPSGPFLVYSRPVYVTVATVTLVSQSWRPLTRSLGFLYSAGSPLSLAPPPALPPILSLLPAGASQRQDSWCRLTMYNEWIYQTFSLVLVAVQHFMVDNPYLS